MKTRIIQTRFWDDEFVSNLKPDAKLVFLYLLTNDSIGMTGIYEKPIRAIAFYTGVSEKRMPLAMQEISDKVIYDNGWVVLKNAVKYNNYASNSKQITAYMKEWNNLPEHLQQYAPYYEAEDYKPKYVTTGTGYKHRDVAESALGRKLLENEVVHHIDKDPSNNDPGNLAVMPLDKHILLHQGKIGIHDTSMILVSEYYDSTPNTEIRNKNTEIRNQKPKTQTQEEPTKVPLAYVQLSYLINIPEDDISEFTKFFECSPKDVRIKAEGLHDYCKSKGKTYKDYKALLRGALRRDFGVREVRPKFNKFGMPIGE
jgi:hypothetical protein